MQTAAADGAPSVSSNSLADTSDILCRGCNNSLYTKVTNTATAQSGKSWRCGACLQLFTVKSSAKRHVSNSHKDPVCRACQDGINPPPPSALTISSVNGAFYGSSVHALQSGNTLAKSGPLVVDGSSMDQDEEDADEEIDLEPELALLTLMLKNHLDLKGVDNVLELLNGGMNFSGIQNASHWLQRLGKHAAVQYTTSNCPNCKRTEVQIKVDQTASGTPGSDGQTIHPVTLATAQNPGSLRADPTQLSQPPGAGVGTVLGVFDPSSGQLITASPFNLDKNTLQKVNTMVHAVPGQMNGVSSIRQLDTTRGVVPLTYTTPAVAVPQAPRKVGTKHPKTPVTSHPAGSVNTSWKAVARTLLQSLHTKDELLRLCVVGRRMDRTSQLGLQPMEASKRKIVGDAVAEHCAKTDIPVPPDTLLNHFMSQILCDSRRKEQLMVCGGELQRRPKKIKTEPVQST